MNVEKSAFSTVGNIMTVCFMAVILVDVIFAKLYDTILNNISPELIISLFLVISIIFVILSSFIMIFVRNSTLSIRGTFIRISRTTGWIILFSTSALVIFTDIKILMDGAYDQTISSYCEIAGLVGAAFLLMILTRQLILSFKLYRSRLLVLFAVAVLSTIAYFLILTGLTFLSIHDKPLVVDQSGLNTTHVYLPIGSIERTLAQASFYLQDISFIALWIASNALLRYRFKKSPTIFFILLFVPVLYFISLVMDIKYFIDIIGTENVLFGIISIIIRSITPLIGGIIFGISFYLAAKRITKNSKLKNYMSITGHGFIILLISSQYSVLLHFPYPPYGMIAISSTYLGSYLLLVGIYATAVSTAHNIKIHDEISRIVRDNLRFSHEMATAIFIDSIENQVSKIEKSLEQKSGIESDLNSHQIREYIEEIIVEKRKSGFK